jgi:D-3-phosphoglycerate dehydrogenase
VKILVTCPPMIGMIDALRPRFAAAGAQVECPPVVQTLSEPELLARVPAYDGWIIGDDPATRAVFAAGRAGRLRAAVKWGVGIDNVDVEAAREHGLFIAHTPGMFGAEVADLALAYVVALARGLHRVDAGVRSGGWPKPRGVSLAGKTVGLAGLGDIGRSFARRARAADLRVVAYDPAHASSLPDLPDVPVCRWPDRLGECDFLVLACALNAGSRHMLNAPALALAKRGVRVVNVSRGDLIDEPALAAALERGTVHSAALDVYAVEPLPPTSPLRQFPQCLFGSHNASNTEEAVLRTSERATALLLDALAGAPR